MLSLLLFACAEQVLVLPDPSALPSSEAPPPLLTGFSTGEEVRSVRDWEGARRPELQALFAHYVYGAVEPDTAAAVASSSELVVGEHRARLLTVDVGLPERPPLTLLLWLPAGPGPFPVLLGPNKCGLHSLHASESLPLPDGFVEDSCAGGSGEEGRGGRSHYWSVDVPLQDGIAVASWHQSDLAPDHPSEPGGLQERSLARDDLSPMGAVSAWSWGNQRALDALIAQPEVDADRVAVFGHSRRGKAALWTAARDERVAAVIAHQSGTGGATLSRSYAGESVAAITLLFPHWFTPRFADFADRETSLPIDQHMLIALAAPRLVLATDGEADTWADPEGARRAVELASPAWGLYGQRGLVVDGSGPTLGGELAWGIREGGHEVRAEDWARWVGFLQGHGW